MAPNPLADLGAGLTTKLGSVSPHPGGPAQHGTSGQIERAFTAASTFFSGMLAISASQFLGAPLKAIDPKFYEAYMAFTKQSFGVLITTMTQWWSPTVVKVSGDTSIPKQLFRKQDGGLECRFPKRLVMMANHQLYTDWLYLWWVAYTNNMHGYVYIILKESLKNVPIVGWGAQFYNFIFLSRKWEQDKSQFAEHLDRLNNPNDPMWLLIFPEGTNLAQSTRDNSKAWAEKNGLQDMKHQLLPRSRGLQFCLQKLKTTTEWLYDVTIGYEGVPPGQFGQDIFTMRSSMLEGRPPKSVNMHFRRFKISAIPLNNDKAFEVWLRNRWREKDYLLEHFSRFNCFPSDSRWMMNQQKIGRTQLIPQPAKIIETQIKSNNIEEFLSIFAPLTSVLMVMFVASGGVSPAEMTEMLKDGSKSGQARLKEIQAKMSQSLQNDVEAPGRIGKFKEIGEMTPAVAQKELIQRYLNSVRPAAAEQITLRDDALRAQSQPPNAGRRLPLTPAAKRKAPAHPAPSLASAPAVANTPKIKAKPPPKRSNTAAAATTLRGQSTNAPTSAMRLSSVTAKTNPTLTKAFTSIPSTSNQAIAAATERKREASQAKTSQARSVMIDPKTLARVQGARKPLGPVSIDPGVLKRMKRG